MEIEKGGLWLAILSLCLSMYAFCVDRIGVCVCEGRICAGRKV